MTYNREKAENLLAETIQEMPTYLKHQNLDIFSLVGFALFHIRLVFYKKLSALYPKRECMDLKNELLALGGEELIDNVLDLLYADLQDGDELPKDIFKNRVSSPEAIYIINDMESLIGSYLPQVCKLVSSLRS